MTRTSPHRHSGNHQLDATIASPELPKNNQQPGTTITNHDGYLSVRRRHQLGLLCLVMGFNFPVSVNHFTPSFLTINTVHSLQTLRR